MVIPKFFDSVLFKYHFFDRSIELSEEQQEEYVFQKLNGVLSQPQSIEGLEMADIFVMQTALMANYEKLGHIPHDKMDFTQKKDQAFFKGLCYEVVTELSEFLEQLSLVGVGVPSDKEDDQENFISDMELLASCNEELSDAFHFMAELMIYARIDNFFGNYTLDTFNKDLSQESLHPKVYKPLVEADILLGINPVVYDGVNLTYPSKLRAIKLQFAEFVRQLTKASNLLKNKSWRVNAQSPDLTQFQNELGVAFNHFMAILSLYGISWYAFVKAYSLKNRINIIRVKSKLY